MSKRTDINHQVKGLNARLGLSSRDAATIDHRPEFGGYRLETDRDAAGFSCRAGDHDPRMSFNEFSVYLEGLHHGLDASNYIERVQCSELVTGLRDMIRAGRLTEADIPDDFAWLKRAIAS